MSELKKPWWWSSDHEFLWDHVKLAMRSSWEQTRGSLLDHRSNRRAPNGVKIAPENLPAFDEIEVACRFGYCAHLQYDGDHSNWSNDLEIQLAKDWQDVKATRQATWEEARNALRYGWNYDEADLKISNSEFPNEIANRAGDGSKPDQNRPVCGAMPQILEGMAKAKWIRPSRTPLLESEPGKTEASLPFLDS